MRVDVLAKQIGVSRGSFYWHFADRDDLLVATLEEWEKLSTTEVIRRLDGVQDPTDRLRRLAHFAYIERPMFGLGPAVSASADHPLIAPILRRVTSTRIDFLTTLYEQLGLDTPEARRRALLAYTIFIGGLELVRVAADIVPELTDEEQREYYFEHAMRVLTIDTASGL